MPPPPIPEPAAPIPLSDWARDPQAAARRPLVLPASAVAFDGQGVLILGAPGRGKSSLALALMAHGAVLVADDGVGVVPAPGATPGIVLQRPETSPEAIEARGLGLLRPGPLCATVPLGLAVDLDRAEPRRLPPRRHVRHEAALAPLVLGGGWPPGLVAALLCRLRHGLAPL